MTLPANIRVNVGAPFPARVTGVGGIAVDKTNGIWVIHPQFEDLTAIVASALGDPTSKQIWIFDPVIGNYNVLTLAGLGDALYKATSVSSLTIGTGSKTFVTQSGKDFGVGSFVLATSDADPTKFMLGQITSYVGTSLVVNVSTVGGSGTAADWTIRASASAGSAGRSSGYLYSWSTSTASSDPTSGKIKANNATLASATQIFISETDSDSNALAAEIATWDDGTSTIRGRLKIYNPTAPANFAAYDVTGTNTDNGTWDTINVTYVAGGGSFLAADALRVNFTPKGDLGNTGATGAAGSNGSNGVDGAHSGNKWLFATSTSMADPSAGNVRLNNATLASVTAAAFSANTAESGNPSVLAYLQAWDDSTSVLHRGYVLIRKISAQQNFAIYDITGALTDNTTWVQLALTHVVSAGSFSASDPLAISFIRTGDKGTDGAGAGDVIGPAASIDNEIALYNSTTGKLIKRATTTGLLKATSGVIAAASAGTDYQVGDAFLTSIAALGTAADKMIYTTGVDTAAEAAITTAGRTLIAAADAAAERAAMGAAYGKQSIWLPAGSWTPRSTNGAAPGVVELASNKNMLTSLDFDTSTQEFAQTSIRMPKSWDLGTISFIPVWSHAATTTNFGVVWGLDAVAVSDGDAQDVAFGTAQTSTDTGGTTNTSYQGPESSAITVAGTPVAGDKVMLRIHRDPANGSDTMAIDARLEGVLVLWTNNANNDT